MLEVRNAIIEGTSLSIDDHGCLSSWLHLTYGGSGQGFGGWSLGPLPESLCWPGNGNYAGVWIVKILQIAGVTEWSKLPGRPIRVRSQLNGVEAIGHILKNEWFSPRELFREMELALPSAGVAAEFTGASRPFTR